MLIFPSDGLVIDILPMDPEHMQSLMDRLRQNGEIDTATCFLGLLAVFVLHCIPSRAGERESFHILKRTFVSFNVFMRYELTRRPTNYGKLLAGLHRSRLITLLGNLTEKPSCDLRSFSSPRDDNPLHTVVSALEKIRDEHQLVLIEDTRMYWEAISGMETMCTRSSPLVDSALCERVQGLSIFRSPNGGGISPFKWMYGECI